MDIEQDLYSELELDSKRLFTADEIDILVWSKAALSTITEDAELEKYLQVKTQLLSGILCSVNKIRCCDEQPINLLQVLQLPLRLAKG